MAYYEIYQCVGMMVDSTLSGRENKIHAPRFFYAPPKKYVFFHAKKKLRVRVTLRFLVAKPIHARFEPVFFKKTGKRGIKKYRKSHRGKTNSVGSSVGPAWRERGIQRRGGFAARCFSHGCTFFIFSHFG
jgi:hypothetical protein